MLNVSAKEESEKEHSQKLLTMLLIVLWQGFPFNVNQLIASPRSLGEEKMESLNEKAWGRGRCSEVLHV